MKTMFVYGRSNCSGGRTRGSAQRTPPRTQSAKTKLKARPWAMTSSELVAEDVPFNIFVTEEMYFRRDVFSTFPYRVE